MQARILALTSLPVLLALAAAAQSPKPAHYILTDLGDSRPFSQAYTVNSYGFVAGLASTPTGTQHAVLWYGKHLFDINGAGLGGPNSVALAVNDSLEVAGQAETGILDPNHENFCVYGTGFTCVPFVWREGVLTKLPTLGGYNGTVGNINRHGVISGFVENATVDPTCPGTLSATGAGPQVLDYEAVLWGKDGKVTELHPLPGDTVGTAFFVNDHGVAVGSSGLCANTLPGPFAIAPHAVLWAKDGSVTDLGNLGGTANPALLLGNVAFGVNNSEQVTGISSLPGSLSHHAFLWTKATGMRDLGTLPGDLVSAGLAINNRGDVVGVSNPGGILAPTARAALWHNGKVADLNDLVPANSALYLIGAFGINDRGQIVGFGATSTGDIHAFLATPCRQHEEGEDE